MLSLPLRRCSQYGCSELVESGRCAKHSGQYEKERNSDPVRSLYRSARWVSTRAYVLKRDPICKIGIKCVEKHGRRMPSTDADHKRRARDVADFFDVTNLQGTCHADHSYKTASEDGGFGNRVTTR
jgi:5-methylcytosine-specific restriction protein A